VDQANAKPVFHVLPRVPFSFTEQIKTFAKEDAVSAGVSSIDATISDGHSFRKSRTKRSREPECTPTYDGASSCAFRTTLHQNAAGWQRSDLESLSLSGASMKKLAAALGIVLTAIGTAALAEDNDTNYPYDPREVAREQAREVYRNNYGYSGKSATGAATTAGAMSVRGASSANAGTRGRAISRACARASARTTWTSRAAASSPTATTGAGAELKPYLRR
jgi:hypothetical protein